MSEPAPSQITPFPVTVNKKDELRRTKKLRRSIYVAGVFLTFNASIVSYINSSFLAKLIGENLVGLVFSAAALLSIISFIILPRILVRFDLRRTLIILSLFALFSTLIIGLNHLSAWIAISLFVVFYITGPLLRYCLDIYLEFFSNDNETGGIRGFMLTVINLSWLASPLLAGALLGTSENYGRVYLGAAVAALPLIFILTYGFRTVTTARKDKVIWPSFHILYHPQTAKDRDLANLILIDFILNFFYALMVIYTPLYLHEHIGLSWSAIGTAFTIMLLPFVLIEYPLGQLADKKYGEKEIIAGGLLIMGLSTIALSYITTPSIALWAGVLFITRIGAAAVEIGKETYLFKNINAGDSSILSLARMTMPLSYLVGPVAATVFLLFFDFRFIFFALGLIVLFGLRYALVLVDTK